MICHVTDAGELKRMQLSSYPACSLFSQELISSRSVSAGGTSDTEPAPDAIRVRYHAPAKPLAPPHRLQAEPLTVPLHPDTTALEKVDFSLHYSPTACYRMGSAYDAWFSACFGHAVALLYLGDGRRRVLGSIAPEASATAPPPQRAAGLLSTAMSYLWGGGKEEEQSWITFTDCAPMLVTSEVSRQDVSARLPGADEVPVYKFRPNLVVDGAGEEAWAEDFWGGLEFEDGRRLVLTANCGRCSSLNVDYDTGVTAEGEKGTVLKKLMKDRRVDKGNKWAPVFGRYAFLQGKEELQVKVGDEVKVTERVVDRAVWFWPGLGSPAK